MRVTTPAQDAALAAERCSPVWFIQMGLGVTQRWCTALETLVWDGHPWLGIGTIIQMENMREHAELEINSLKISFTGVPVEIIALVEREPIQGRRCDVWIGLYDENAQMIDSPIREYGGRLDTPSNKESARNEDGIIVCELTFTVESRFAFGLKAKTSRRTDAEQQRLYPGDRCMEFIPQTTSVTVDGWGRG